MKIITPSPRQRRDPLGVHKCRYCHCQFEVEQADLANPDVIHQDGARTDGDLFATCPSCGQWCVINEFPFTV